MPYLVVHLLVGAVRVQVLAVMHIGLDGKREKGGREGVLYTVLVKVHLWILIRVRSCIHSKLQVGSIHF